MRVERGFKAGREMMLSKAETTMGRAEGVDIALFGDMGVEKRHARIVMQKDRYVLDGGPAGTAGRHVRQRRAGLRPDPAQER